MPATPPVSGSQTPPTPPSPNRAWSQMNTNLQMVVFEMSSDNGDGINAYLQNMSNFINQAPASPFTKAFNQLCTDAKNKAGEDTLNKDIANLFKQTPPTLTEAQLKKGFKESYTQFADELSSSPSPLPSASTATWMNSGIGDFILLSRNQAGSKIGQALNQSENSTNYNNAFWTYAGSSNPTAAQAQALVTAINQVVEDNHL